MAWQLVGVGTSVNVTTTSHTLTLPAGVQQGDLLVACISSRINSTTSITLPTGGEWNLIGEQKNNNILTTSSALPSGMMAYCIRGASDPNLTFTHPAAPSPALGRIVVYRGHISVGSVDTFSVQQTPTATTNCSVTGLTTTGHQALLVAMACGGQEAAWSNFRAATDPPTGSGATDLVINPTTGTWEERSDVQTTTSNDTSLGIFDAVKGVAGPTGNFLATASVSAGHVIIVAAFHMHPTYMTRTAFADEIGSFASTATVGANASIDNTQSLGGAYSVKTGGASGATTVFFNTLSLARPRIKCHIRVGSIANPSPSQILYQIAALIATGGGQNLVFYLKHGADNVFYLEVQDAVGAFIFSTAVTIAANTWYRVELDLIAISSTVGSCAVYLDGAQVGATVTGQNFNTTNMQQWQAGFHTFGAGSPRDFWFDNIEVEAAALCGNTYVIARSPVAGTPTYDAWSKSTGSDAYAVLNDTPVDTADFISSSTSNAAQTVRVGSLLQTQSGHGLGKLSLAQQVYGCRLAIIAKAASATSASLRYRVDGADTDNAISLTTADAYYEQPVNAPFYQLEEIEIGIVHGAHSTLQTVEDAWFIISYDPSGGMVIPATTNLLLQTNLIVSSRMFRAALATLSASTTLSVSSRMFLRAVTDLSASSTLSIDATILSGVLQATALLSGSTTLSVNASKFTPATTVLSGSTTLSVNALRFIEATALLSGNTTLTLNALRFIQASTLLSANTTLSVQTSQRISAFALLSASTTLTAQARLALRAAAVLSADTTLTANAIRYTFANAVLAGNTSLIANAAQKFATNQAVLAANTTLRLNATLFGAAEEINALLAGDTTLTALVRLSLVARATLIGDTTLTAQTSLALRASALLAGNTTLSAQTSLALRASAVLAGNTTLSAQTSLALRASALLAASSTLNVNALRFTFGNTTLAANTALIARAGQRFVTNPALLSSTSTLSIDAILAGAPGTMSALLAGSTALTVNSTLRLVGRATLPSSTDLVANAAVFKPTAAVLSASSTLTVQALRYIPATALLSVSTTLDVATIILAPGISALLAGNSTLNLSMQQVFNTAAILAADSTLRCETIAQLTAYATLAAQTHLFADTILFPSGFVPPRTVITGTRGAPSDIRRNDATGVRNNSGSGRRRNLQ